MVKLRPYVVAVNHVPGCPRLESGQGGRKLGRRRCAPGCSRETNGWEVDLALRLPDGTPIRERVKAPVSGRSAALRWAQEREGQILAQKGRRPKEERQVPTLAEFKPRFIEGHVKAKRLKPSSAQSYEDIFRVHLVPEFGTRRLDEIGNELVQRFKGELVEDELANKTINNVLTALSVTLKRAVEWDVIPAMPCRIRLLKVNRGELAFYDFGDYQRLVEAAEALDPRIELLVLLGGDAGLRRGEAIGLEWTDVDLRRRAMITGAQGRGDPAARSEAGRGRGALRLRAAFAGATLRASGSERARRAGGLASERRTNSGAGARERAGNRWRRLGDGGPRREKPEGGRGVAGWGAREANRPAPRYPDVTQDDVPPRSMRARRRLVPYAAALAFSAAALALVGLTSHRFGGVFFHFPLVAVFAAALYGGPGPGLLAVVVCWLGVDLLYVGPPMRLGVSTTEEAHRIFAFLLAGSAATWIAARFRRARRQADAARRAAERARDEARRVGELQERLVAVVGHDLRNPLGALLGNLDLLARAGPLGDRQQLVAARMRATVLRMEGLIRDLLDLARTRQGGLLAVAPADVRLGDVCRRTLGEIRDGHPDLRVELALSGEDRIEVDPERVAQVVSNLVANAVQHGAGGAPVRVRVSGREREVALEVENEGPPIPAELARHLFEPFRRGADDGKGLGLGLFVVHEVARGHGGAVSFRSEGGRTVFEVTFPRTPPPPRTEGRRTSAGVAG